MGSIAMDSAGDIALGYSKSSANAASGDRLRRAPGVATRSGTMGFAEGTIINGTGSQQGTGSRWGDYSSLSVDPNGCTFWYTTEHYTRQRQVRLGHPRRRRSRCRSAATRSSA